MEFKLPKKVEYILAVLESAGFSAHVVGGSVRDLLLGKSPDDYDITTSATPEQTKAAFAECRTVDTGIKHGTVSLILDGKAYEITTYRLDGEYKDARHPESVSFTSCIKEDLARRDFTVNAIAYSPVRGITDPFGGQNDLRKGIIRAVGDPRLRFSEDALRILRGIRFSSVLGFEIEGETEAALREKKHLLPNVSAERIYVELCKMLSGRHAYNAVLKYADVISEVIPCLKKIELPSEAEFSNADFLTRFMSVFYCSSADPSADFTKACADLRTDSFTRDRGGRLLSSVGKYDLHSELGMTRLLRDFGGEGAEALIKLEIAVGRTDGDAQKRLEWLLSSNVCYRLSDLALGGNDILSIGAKGREVGEILDRLLTAVIEKRVENERNALLAFAMDGFSR